MSNTELYTKLSRYKDRLVKLEERRNILMRAGKYIQSMELNRDIEDVRKLIAAEEDYLKPKPLKELVSKEQADEVTNIIIECHLAADYLTAMAYEIKDWFDKNGLIPHSVIPELNQIVKLSESFAGSVCKVNPNLRDMMINNDTLIEALHKKCQTYIKRNLNPKKKAKNEKSE